MKRGEQLSDEEKNHFISTEENTKYANLILSKKPEEMTFSETLEILSNSW